MSKNRNKYRPIIFLLSFFYLNFFFLSPYFHHHHPESESPQEKKETVHTHLFSDLDHNSHTEEADHHLDDENHHSHLFQNNLVNITAPSRELETALNIGFYYTVEYSIQFEEVSLINRDFKEPFSQFQWEKYVHSATNVSPPLT